MIRIAREKQIQRNISNVDFEIGDSCNLAFENSTFDVVIASNVLHFLYDPVKSLSEIRRVIKPGGIAILSTFCHAENVQSRIISRFMSLFGFQARNKWSARSFTSFIKSNNFSIKKAEIITGKIPLMYCVAQIIK